MKALILTLGLLAAPTAWACTFDTDCDPGFKCVKTGYDYKGVCVGDRYSPKAPEDRRPYQPKWNYDKKGQSCSYDVQCGVGLKCLKAGGSIYGVCG